MHYGTLDFAISSNEWARLGGQILVYKRKIGKQLEGTEYVLNSNMLLFHSSEICRVPPQAESLKVFQKWHVCYHGTAPEKVSKILESGGLLAPG